MYRRSGAPRASVRGQRKIDQQSKKTPRTVIGVSAIPLSSRFTHLTDETPRPTEKQHQVTVQAKPKGNQNKLANKKPTAQQNEAKGGRGAAGRGAAGRGAAGRGAAGRGAAGRGGRGGRGGSGGCGDAKAKPPTGDDLDMEMDEYWHEAGKGPDPKAAQLDRQMEAYWAAKPAHENSTKTEGDDAAADATMES
ncbi:hypothetical protein JM18_000909 [Phytophthora kernoviae]|uniref:Chromatin target of PRMT1 protein C-terminal domain-containing protein n=1 Tax=Phytophthora kernoviae TaxID=325452 RepID=A0A8T0M7I8_9STRA|nr:hypothetical protein JM16_001450 [Phytophthora kernoviae]KAG2532934.1 hypothetical protein JM18_000909 [Phytophthora kernoviae]